MEVNYDFVPEYESFERKKKSDILSFAGKKPPGVGHPSGAYFVLTRITYFLGYL